MTDRSNRRSWLLVGCLKNDSPKQSSRPMMLKPVEFPTKLAMSTGDREQVYSSWRWPSRDPMCSPYVVHDQVDRRQQYRVSLRLTVPNKLPNLANEDRHCNGNRDPYNLMRRLVWVRDQSEIGQLYRTSLQLPDKCVCA